MKSTIVPNRIAIPFVVFAMTAVLQPCHAQTPDYVPVRVEPKVIRKADLEFPDNALGASVCGKIWVKVLIGRDGTPVKTEILKREPDIAYMFDEGARRWAMECRFSPAIGVNGDSVAVWVTIPLNYKIQDFQPPAVTELAVPEYPEEARALGMEGWVGIAILVGDMGNVGSAQTVIVAREPSTTKVFDAAAIAAARASKYRAAMQNGSKTVAWCFVKVVFKIPEP